MMNLIVATSTKEQQDIMSFLRESLKLTYHADASITIIQASIIRLDVYHSVKGTKNLVKSYKVIIVPISMSLESLNGYSHDTNININRLIDKLDRMKAEAVCFVNHFKNNTIRKQKDAHSKIALANAVKLLFD